jgi:transcriptional regulator with XRE-family HTH domain
MLRQLIDETKIRIILPVAMKSADSCLRIVPQTIIPLPMNIGESIRRHRKRLKLTREALATKARVSERSLYSYEAGKQSPSLSQIQNIARVLKLTPSELLDDSYTIKRRMSEEEIVDQILSLCHRADIRAAGVVRIVSKVLQELPLEAK